jgi:hypothetical protein
VTAVLAVPGLASGDVPGWLALLHPAASAVTALIASAASPIPQILTMTSCGVAARTR